MSCAGLYLVFRFSGEDGRPVLIGCTSGQDRDARHNESLCLTGPEMQPGKNGAQMQCFSRQNWASCGKYDPLCDKFATDDAYPPGKWLPPTIHKRPPTAYALAHYRKRPSTAFLGD